MSDLKSTLLAKMRGLLTRSLSTSVDRYHAGRELGALMADHASELLDAVDERDRLRLNRESVGELRSERTSAMIAAQQRNADLEDIKRHMDYCRTLVPLEDGGVLADGIEVLKKRVAELEAALKRIAAMNPNDGHALHDAVKVAELALRGGVIVFPSALGKTTNLLKGGAK